MMLGRCMLLWCGSVMHRRSVFLRRSSMMFGRCMLLWCGSVMHRRSVFLRCSGMVFGRSMFLRRNAGLRAQRLFGNQMLRMAPVDLGE